MQIVIFLIIILLKQSMLINSKKKRWRVTSETLAPCVTTLNSQSFNSEITRLLIIIKHSNKVGKIIIKSGPSCTWLRKIWTLVSSVIWSIFYCFLLVLYDLSLAKASLDHEIQLSAFSSLLYLLQWTMITWHCISKMQQRGKQQQTKMKSSQAIA